MAQCLSSCYCSGPDAADPQHLCGGPRIPVDTKPTDAEAPSVQWCECTESVLVLL